MGQYLVGFDPMGYYVPNTVLWLRNGVDFSQLMSSVPLLYLLLMGLTLAGAPLVLTLKVLGPLLLGLLGFVIYHYAHRSLTWSPKKSLLVALFSTLYFVALRISWDMFRSELALILLFVVLILLKESGHKKRNVVLLSATMILVVLSHQLISVVMFAIIIALLLRAIYKKQKIDLFRIAASSIPAALLFSVLLYVNFFVNASSPLLGYSVNYSGGIDSLASASHLYFTLYNLGFIAFCFVPLLPLVLLGVKRFQGGFELKAWIIWLLIPLILALVTPNAVFLGGVLPYRWVMLLTFPLSFFATEGISRMIRKPLPHKLGLAAIAVVLIVLSASFVVLPNNEALGYYAAYPTYIPKSMLQNTLQLSDCQDAVNALIWARNNLPSDGYLLVHEAFYGYALMSFDINRITPYFFGNLTEITRQLQESNATTATYLIWWVNNNGWYGQSTVPSAFIEIYHSGNIAIYHYVG